MRKPKLATTPTFQRKDNGMVTQTRQYELITPLFGGGVTPGETDPVTPIRGTEIRGHLRFWWRATRGGKKQFAGKSERMKEFEDGLWGAAGDSTNKTGSSQVQIAVKILDPNAIKPFPVRDRDGNEIRERNGNKIGISHIKSPYGYAAFPLESQQTVTEGVSFELCLSFPKEQQAEIEAALWAWETFGGIGARTRRGFGALRCLKIDNRAVPTLPASRLDAYIKAKLDQHIDEEDWIDNMPHLSKNIQLKVTGISDTALIAWEKLLKSLKSFRQEHRFGRFGRSKWPEPDEIRRLTGQSYPPHSRPVSASPVQKFPRADFGLPIVFHFKDEDANNPTNPKADPRQTTLQGIPDPDNNYDRLASPLILRPILCSNNQAVGLAVILEAPRRPPTGLMLKDAPGNPGVRADLTLAETKNIDIPPLKGQTDVLKAFLNTL